MSKGQRNREKRKEERRRAAIARDMKSPVTEAEIFAVDCIIDFLDVMRYPQGSPEREAIIERAKKALIKHRHEVRQMYADNRKLLQEWMMRQIGPVAPYNSAEQIFMEG